MEEAGLLAREEWVDGDDKRACSESLWFPVNFKGGVAVLPSS